MNIDKLLDKKVGNAISEYNRITKILYPDAEPVSLTHDQSDALAFDAIDTMIAALAGARNKLEFNQSKRELAGYNDYHQAQPADYPTTEPAKRKKF
jgi:hypothetical protein